MGFLIWKQILKYFLMMLSGFLIVKCKILKAEDSKVLSVLSIYLILPCAIIHSFQIEATPENIRGLALTFSAAILIHILMIALGNILGMIFHMDEVEKVSSIYSNAGNMILPLILSVLGEEWVLYASANMSVQVCFLWMHGKMVLCEERDMDWKKIFHNINIITILMGILMFAGGMKLPSILEDATNMIGSMLAPAGMIIVGMIMGDVSPGRIFQNKRIYLVCMIRVLILPLAVLAGIYVSGAWKLGPDAPVLLFISFLSITTAVSTSVMQMAQVYGKDAEYAGAINILTTLVCLFTMPVLANLYEKLFL